MATETEVQLPERWANPELLEWARLRMGLEPREVERLTKIPFEHITRWEQREGAPTLEQLEVLAEAYDCPVGYFFLDSPQILNQ